jgi:NAD-dependent dihydropyrimidine dehydrogenase PreA subunit
MLVIHAERCSGCGTCVEVCPDGAIYLVDGKAVVDGTLCRHSEACLSACITACPMEAIEWVEEATIVASEPVRVPAPRPVPEIVPVTTESLVPVRAKVLSAVGAGLIWAGREIVPRLAEYALHSLDRRAAEKQRMRALRDARNNGSRACSRGSGGRRRRRRRRGG